MAKINEANPNAGVTQYDGDRADVMAKVAEQQYLNAVDETHKAIYAMEMFNIFMEQKMHAGLDVFDGGSHCTLKEGWYNGPWYFDPTRPKTIRLSTQGGEGPDVGISELKRFSAHWAYRTRGGEAIIWLTAYPDEDIPGRIIFEIEEEFEDEYGKPIHCGTSDSEMFHNGTFDPSKVSSII